MKAEQWGAVAAFFSSVTWAVGSAYYSKLGATYLPFAINLTRALIALPLFLVTALISLGGFTPTLAEFARVEPAHMGWLFLSIFASYGFGDSLFIVSTRILGVPSAMAIASIFPLWATLLGAWTENQMPTVHQWIGLALTLIGVTIVVLALPTRRLEKGTAKTFKSQVSGVALAFVTSFCWALNSYSVSRGSQDMPVSIGNVIRMGFGVVFIFITGRLLAPKSYALLQKKDLKKYGWIFMVESYGGAYLYLYGLREALLVVAATLSSLSPVLSVPAALILKLEKFSWKRTLGVALTIVGLWFLVS